MSLLTVFGHYDRAAVIARAKQLRKQGLVWNEAMKAAYGEAQAERNALTGSSARRCHRLALEADCLSALENAR